MLDFNEQKYFFLCADLAVDTISVALVNLRFQVLAHRSRPVQDREIQPCSSNSSWKRRRRS